MSLAFLDFVALGLSLAASFSGAVHALMTKRDPRSAAAWITLCLLFPLVGVLVYVAIGNNRIDCAAQPPSRIGFTRLSSRTLPARLTPPNRLRSSPRCRYRTSI